MALSFRRGTTVLAGSLTIGAGLLIGVLVFLSRVMDAFGGVAFTERAARAEALEAGIGTAVLQALGCGGVVVLAGAALILFAVTRTEARRDEPPASGRGGA